VLGPLLMLGLAWLFLLAVAALCGEWYARKRLGLR
jgi:hypothetical protein